MATLKFNYLTTVYWELPEGPFPNSEGEKPLGWKTFLIENDRFPTEEQALKAALKAGAGKEGLTVAGISYVPLAWSDKPTVSVK